MRRPVIDVLSDGMGFWHIEVKLPKQTFQALNEAEELVDKEEIPEVMVIPYPTHVIISVGAGGRKPRIRHKPTHAFHADFDKIVFGEWDWALFWEGVEENVN